RRHQRPLCDFLFDYWFTPENFGYRIFCHHDSPFNLARFSCSRISIWYHRTRFGSTGNEDAWPVLATAGSFSVWATTGGLSPMASRIAIRFCFSRFASRARSLRKLSTSSGVEDGPVG